jgi:hypothetical protein
VPGDALREKSIRYSGELPCSASYPFPGLTGEFPRRPLGSFLIVLSPVRSRVAAIARCGAARES